MRERGLIYIVGEMSREEEIKAQRGDVEKKKHFYIFRLLGGETGCHRE